MSFEWMSTFRQGSWREYRRFILNQRKDVAARIRTLNAEINRIGFIRVYYDRASDTDTTRTEFRTGIDVQPNTSLGKLLQAYVAQGGNPFDISMFMYPDVGVQSGTRDDGDGNEIPLIDQDYPYHGYVWPQGVDPGRGNVFTGGWLPLWRYPPRKQGTNQTSVADQSQVTFPIERSRTWVRQDLQYLRRDLEAKILKLCDLREQLTQERDEILPQAVGGTVEALSFDGVDTQHVSSIVADIDGIFYPVVDEVPDMDNPREYSPNNDYSTLVVDAPTGEEDWTALG
jgi:hypothetical protein